MPTVNDDFNRADQNPLAGNWTTCSGFSNMRLSSNHVGGASNNQDCFVYWNANEFDPDHYVQVEIYGSYNHQPCVRVDLSDTDNFYCL